MAGAGRVLRQHALEIAEELRHALLEEEGAATLRLGALILVIEAARDRMMGLMHLGHEIGDGELQLVRPQPSGLVLGCETVPGSPR